MNICHFHLVEILKKKYIYIAKIFYLRRKLTVTDPPSKTGPSHGFKDLTEHFVRTHGNALSPSDGRALGDEQIPFINHLLWTISASC